MGRSKSYQIDMCQGPLLGQIIRFVIPLIVSGMLQLLFNSADLIVIGRLASHQALAAVGATAPLTFVLVNMFIGLSVGTNVLVARYIGEKNRKDLSRTVHTAIMTSVIGGTVLAVIGVAGARTMLRWMCTPDEILDMSTLYMWIYFSGMPVVMLYNFGSAVMRAQGDTTRPFYYLLFGGIVNVLLNLFFVTVFHWDVAGVAAATVISQAIAAYLVVRALHNMRGACRVKWQVLHIEWKNFREIMNIGVPAGFQGSCFSISNMIIMSSVNTFGTVALAGVTASGTLDALAFITLGSISQAVVSFVSQNYGAKNLERVKKSISLSLILCYISSFVTTLFLLLFSKQLVGIFNSNQEVISIGVRRMFIILPLLFCCGISEILTGSLRGLGYSLMPAVITVFFICILRIIWVYTVFRKWHTLDCLLISYPVSWVLNCAAIAVLFWIVIRKIRAKDNV